MNNIVPAGIATASRFLSSAENIASLVPVTDNPDTNYWASVAALTVGAGLACKLVPWIARGAMTRVGDAYRRIRGPIAPTGPIVNEAARQGGNVAIPPATTPTNAGIAAGGTAAHYAHAQHVNLVGTIAIAGLAAARRALAFSTVAGHAAGTPQAIAAATDAAREAARQAALLFPGADPAVVARAIEAAAGAGAQVAAAGATNATIAAAAGAAVAKFITDNAGTVPDANKFAREAANMAAICAGCIVIEIAAAGEAAVAQAAAARALAAAPPPVVPLNDALAAAAAAAGLAAAQLPVNAADPAPPAGAHAALNARNAHLADADVCAIAGAAAGKAAAAKSLVDHVGDNAAAKLAAKLAARQAVQVAGGTEIQKVAAESAAEAHAGLPTTNALEIATAAATAAAAAATAIVKAMIAAGNRNKLEIQNAARAAARLAGFAAGTLDAAIDALGQTAFDTAGVAYDLEMAKIPLDVAKTMAALAAGDTAATRVLTDASQAAILAAYNAANQAAPAANFAAVPAAFVTANPSPPTAANRLAAARAAGAAAAAQANSQKVNIAGIAAVAGHAAALSAIKSAITVGEDPVELAKADATFAANAAARLYGATVDEAAVLGKVAGAAAAAYAASYKQTYQANHDANGGDAAAKKAAGFAAANAAVATAAPLAAKAAGAEAGKAAAAAAVIAAGAAGLADHGAAIGAPVASEAAKVAALAAGDTLLNANTAGAAALAAAPAEIIAAGVAAAAVPVPAPAGPPAPKTLWGRVTAFNTQYGISDRVDKWLPSKVDKGIATVAAVATLGTWALAAGSTALVVATVGSAIEVGKQYLDGAAVAAEKSKDEDAAAKAAAAAALKLFTDFDADAAFQRFDDTRATVMEEDLTKPIAQAEAPYRVTPTNATLAAGTGIVSSTVQVLAHPHILGELPRAIAKRLKESELFTGGVVATYRATLNKKGESSLSPEKRAALLVIGKILRKTTPLAGGDLDNLRVQLIALGQDGLPEFGLSPNNKRAISELLVLLELRACYHGRANIPEAQIASFYESLRRMNPRDKEHRQGLFPAVMGESSPRTILKSVTRLMEQFPEAESTHRVRYVIEGDVLPVQSKATAPKMIIRFVPAETQQGKPIVAKKLIRKTQIANGDGSSSDYHLTGFIRYKQATHADPSGGTEASAVVRRVVLKEAYKVTWNVQKWHDSTTTKAQADQVTDVTETLDALPLDNACIFVTALS